jgi:release factor glutamine methyltransferase
MSSKTWTIKELLAVTSDYLKQKKIESPRLCAEILLAHLLQTSRVDLYLHFEKPLNDSEIEGYRALVRRRLAREPVQHITGVQEFWSLGFQVGPQVLIPRPESEVLVEQALSLYNEGRLPGGERPRILDLGTGCGALAVALAREIRDACIWASDISEEALTVARLNAERHAVGNRIQFTRSDLLTTFGSAVFDLILSNPPYIASREFAALSPEVRDFEPKIALDGREEGLYYIQEIIRQAPEHLNEQGWLTLEMDPRQISGALKLISADDRYAHADRVRDYSKRERVVIARIR